MWNLLNPAFLYAALAALIPLILHLWQQRRTTRVPLSTVRFLKMAQKKSSSRIRMENLLLWLLRTLLMLVLALAFAIPVIRTQGLGSLVGSSHRDIAIVIDVSYSMGYETGNRRAWDTALDAALSVIESLRSGDRVSIVLADDQPVTLLETPNGDLAMVANLIKAQQVRTGSSNLRDAMMTAVNTLRESKHREREVFIISDGQSLPWNGFADEMNSVPGGPSGTVATVASDFGSKGTNTVTKSTTAAWDPDKIDKDIVFFTILTGPVKPENSFADRVEVTPSLILPDTTPKLNARISHSGAAQSVAISLMIDDAEVNRRTLVLEENATVTMPFTLPSLPPGTHTARVVLPSDGLTIDDTFHFLLRVKRELPVLAVGREKDTFFLNAALNPGANSSGIRATRIESEALAGQTLRDYSAIFLCNALPLSGQQMLMLETFVKGGGVLVILPGDDAAPKAYADWACMPAKVIDTVEPQEENRVWSLRLLTRQDPLFLGFQLPPGAVPTIAVKRHLHFGDPADSDGVPVIVAVDRAGGTTPFLLSRNYGKGRVLVFAVSADRVWSTLPLTSFFLPMVHQVVQFGAGFLREPLFVWNSRTLLLSDFLPDLADTDAITTPGDARLSVRAIRKENLILYEAENVQEPGVYRIARNGGPKEPVMAVNVRRNESDLQVIDSSRLEKMTGLHSLRTTRDVLELRQQIDEHRKGRPLTEFCFWLALVLAIFEIYLANRMSRRKSTLTDHLDVAQSGRVAAAMKD